MGYYRDSGYHAQLDVIQPGKFPLLAYPSYRVASGGGISRTLESLVMHGINYLFRDNLMNKYFLIVGLLFSQFTYGYEICRCQSEKLTEVCKVACTDGKTTVIVFPTSPDTPTGVIPLSSIDPKTPSTAEIYREYLETYRLLLEQYRKNLEAAREHGEIAIPMYRDKFTNYKKGIQSYRRGIDEYKAFVNSAENEGHDT